MPIIHHRKSPRHPDYDYSMPGAYFITACTRDRQLLFETLDAKLAVESGWHSLLDIYAGIELGEFVVMPNHVHGIVWIVGEGCYRIHPGTWKQDNQCRDGQLPVPTNVIKFETLSNIIGAFKTNAASRINKLRGVIGALSGKRVFMIGLYVTIVNSTASIAIFNITPYNGWKIGITPPDLHLGRQQNRWTIIGTKYFTNK